MLRLLVFEWFSWTSLNWKAHWREAQLPAFRCSRAERMSRSRRHCLIGQRAKEFEFCRNPSPVARDAVRHLQAEAVPGHRAPAAPQLPGYLGVGPSAQQPDFASAPGSRARVTRPDTQCGPPDVHNTSRPAQTPGDLPVGQGAEQLVLSRGPLSHFEGGAANAEVHAPCPHRRQCAPLRQRHRCPRCRSVRPSRRAMSRSDARPSHLSSARLQRLLSYLAMPRRHR